MKIKSFQKGTTSLGAGSGSTTATISVVVTANSVVFLSYSLSDASPQFGMISIELTNSTTLTFARLTAAASPAVTLRWNVIEFDSGVTVQRGTFTWSGAETTHNTTITAVTTANTFADITSRDAGSSYNDDDMYRAEITSTTNLATTSFAAPANTAIVKWQVVECTDGTFSTQTGNITWGTTDVSLTAAPTTTTQSWLHFSYLSDIGTGANIGQKLIHGVVTSSSLITFTRNNSGQAMTLTWWCITHTDNTLIQRGTEAFTTSETLRNVALTTVDTEEAFPVAGGIYGRGGKSAYSGDDNPGVGGWTDMNITTPINLAITRALTGTATAEIGWFVIEFEAFFPPELFLSRRTNLRTL